MEVFKDVDSKCSVESPINKIVPGAQLLLYFGVAAIIEHDRQDSTLRAESA
jgi:hypothetical protein